MLNLYFVNRQNTIVYVAHDEHEALSLFLDDIEKANKTIEDFNIYCTPLDVKQLEKKRLFTDVITKDIISVSFKECLEKSQKHNAPSHLYCILEN